MENKFLKIGYWLLAILLFVILNSGTIFFLISKLVEIDITKIDLSEWGRSTKNKFEWILASGVDKENGLYVSFWELINGWREFLVWTSIIAGAISSIFISFKTAFKSIKNKKEYKILNKQKREEYELLKLKIKADLNQINDRDLKKIEREVYGR